MPTHDRSSFENLYAGQPRWETGRPQKALVQAADRVIGTVLDCGCGTGENALFFASRGHTVTGIDFLHEPVALATDKAHQRHLRATFHVMDALTINPSFGVFDTVLDSGLFHVFSDADRARYIAALRSVLVEGGKLILLCFSDQEPGTQGPRRVSEDELRRAFASGWRIESLERSRYEVRDDAGDPSSLEGGPKAWFAVIAKSTEAKLAGSGADRR